LREDKRTEKKRKVGGDGGRMIEQRKLIERSEKEGNW
jgi:hypothetical protein